MKGQPKVDSTLGMKVGGPKRKGSKAMKVNGPNRLFFFQKLTFFTSCFTLESECASDHEEAFVSEIIFW